MEQAHKRALLMVKQLLSLAGGATTPEEEARNAAMAAVRLIKKHGFTVVEAQAEPPKQATPPVATPKPTTRDEDLDEMFGVRSDGSFVYGRPKPSPPEKERTASTNKDYIKITSKYAGSCKECLHRYSAGDVVYWKPQGGCWHVDCVDNHPGDYDNDPESFW